MKRKIVLAILIAAALFLLGALMAKWVLTDTFDVKLLVSALGAMAAIVKCLDIKSDTRDYGAEYRDVIRTAFQKPHRPKLYKKLLKAIALYNRDALKQAISRLKALLPHCQTADDHSAVLIFYALCHAEMGLRDEAIAAYREAVRRDMTRSTAWSNMGLLLEQKGDRTEAMSCYENALMYDGENPYAYNNLAAAYYRMCDYEEAIRYGEKALERKSNLYQAADILCLAHGALGNAEESAKYFRLSVANGGNGNALRSLLKEYAEVSVE